jgi:hypothetical protein
VRRSCRITHRSCQHEFGASFAVDPPPENKTRTTVIGADTATNARECPALAPMPTLGPFSGLARAAS